LGLRISVLDSLEASLRRTIKSEIEASVAQAKSQGEAWVGSWNDAAVQSELKLGTSLVALGESDQSLQGFLLFRPPGPFWEIILLVTLPSFRAQGVASELIEALFSHAASVGNPVGKAMGSAGTGVDAKDSAPQRSDGGKLGVELGLEVRADNLAALRCYKLCGFIEQGRRKGYYPDGVDAVLMGAARS
jgi:ribosomal protein S18 acetylase RimI-like enzyme